jgi:hypothetical protein
MVMFAGATNDAPFAGEPIDAVGGELGVEITVTVAVEDVVLAPLSSVATAVRLYVPSLALNVAS